MGETSFINVSRAAARELDMISRGTAMVIVELHKCAERLANHTERKEMKLQRKASGRENPAMSSKFAIGDKVNQAFSNHAEGTVIAILTNQAGIHRYVVEMLGHRTIQTASEGNSVAHGGLTA